MFFLGELTQTALFQLFFPSFPLLTLYAMVPSSLSSYENLMIVILLTLLVFFFSGQLPLLYDYNHQLLTHFHTSLSLEFRNI